MQKSERCVSTFLAHRFVLRFIVCEGAREYRACLNSGQAIRFKVRLVEDSEARDDKSSSPENSCSVR